MRLNDDADNFQGALLFGNITLSGCLPGSLSAIFTTS